MEADEYRKLAELETDHWYYVGKREIVRHWICRTRKPSANDLLLDCGAGTGLFASEMEKFCRVIVLDDHEEALRMLRKRFRPDQILSLAGDRVPLPDQAVDYVTALDVLEHVPDDHAVVRGFRRIVRPGGLAVITVPASMSLWSDWDVALHHYRRYGRRQLVQLFPQEDWDILHVSHINVVAYPAVWLLRRWRRWYPPASGRPRPEDRMPQRPINAILRRIFVSLGCLSFRWPFGVGLLLVARRR